MWMLDPTGALNFCEHFEPTLEIDPQDAGSANHIDVAAAPSIAIRFGQHVDGRGFSLAKRLADQLAGRGTKIIATGHLTPDQARHAFQCGFDLVAIADDLAERHGQRAWRDALRNSVTALYHHRESNAGIWRQRNQMVAKNAA